MPRTLLPGKPYPQGATWDGTGVNFALYSESATGVEVCLFENAGADPEIISLRECTGFIWHGYIPGVKIADQDTATIGAYHTSDVPYWFGTQDALNMIHATRRWTDFDRDLSRKMTAALIAFANTGNPNTSAVPWPKWAPTNEQLVEFGDSISVQKMNTPRLEFMAIHGGGQSTLRAARD